MCLYFWSKSLLKKKIQNISFLYNMTSRKKCNVYVTISVFFKKKNFRTVFGKWPFNSVFEKMVVLRSEHRDVFFNRALLHLRWNSLKNVCKGVQLLVKLQVTGLQIYQKWTFSRCIFQRFCITISHHSFFQNNYFFCTSWKLFLCSENLGRLSGKHQE